MVAERRVRAPPLPEAASDAANFTMITLLRYRKISRHMWGGHSCPLAFDFRVCDFFQLGVAGLPKPNTNPKSGDKSVRPSLVNPFSCISGLFPAAFANSPFLRLMSGV